MSGEPDAYRRDVQPFLFEHLNAWLDSRPESLLECDGGPEGRTADIVLARLFGFDGQVDADVRLRRVEPVYLLPIPERLTAIQPESSSLYPGLRTARYVLQSGYAEMQLSPLAAPLPADVKVGPPDFLASVLFVRYRRRT